MDTLLAWFHQLHSSSGLMELIRHGGLLLLVFIIFAETGLLVGFFLPGDSLLITAGILAAPGILSSEPIFNIYLLLGSLTLSAILGDQLGYFLGRKSGARMLVRPDGRFFKKKYLAEAQAFYAQRGGLALVLARFVPILRTFVPFVAGMAQMPYRSFWTYNIIGGILWVQLLTLLGYLLGQSPMVNRLQGIIFVVIVVSLLPLAFGVLKRLWPKSSIKLAEALEPKPEETDEA